MDEAWSAHVQSKRALKDEDLALLDRKYMLELLLPLLLS
ncbi:hypothetical protein AB3S75_010310 [Citrus x aurantiifolia]